ncbi:hypothetical protein C8J56DRAFT_1026497 [Mycena floridula]|nr:hypothetical protein C8J56DRAFT_1026497 [Mycena floridula]
MFMRLVPILFEHMKAAIHLVAFLSSSSDSHLDKIITRVIDPREPVIASFIALSSAWENRVHNLNLTAQLLASWLPILHP